MNPRKPVAFILCLPLYLVGTAVVVLALPFLWLAEMCHDAESALRTWGTM